jgi:hypothetical protein
MADARQCAVQIEGMLRDLRDRARADIDRVRDPKAQALFETTAEVLQGLMKAYEDFAAKNEKAWQ